MMMLIVIPKSHLQHDYQPEGDKIEGFQRPDLPPRQMMRRARPGWAKVQDKSTVHW